MRTPLSPVIALAIAGALSQSGAIAQDTFAAPVRMQAGDKLLGEGRLYPSPVFHDVNGDGRLDVVVGDLPGKLTVALRAPGEGKPVYGPETKVMAADGKELDFENW